MPVHKRVFSQENLAENPTPTNVLSWQKRFNRFSQLHFFPRSFQTAGAVIIIIQCRMERPAFNRFSQKVPPPPPLRESRRDRWKEATVASQAGGNAPFSASEASMTKEKESRRTA
jgi:hypothetical protein|uniref:Uncharacterized protein n=1 Tax=Zea mays TaxID=4577 RepID=A0A804LLN3_MAIZE